ncbi:sigma-70 family RNA polymerase sigma factor [Nocardia sp. BSTN01]|uniref:sigma-70 family RNA polymerase sigma factor n=1 Tax=Nocardia sp. BSTN01 TaxID=2783665 RepID=UPI00188DF3A5|nr:sigma-70 family RNA polymerase sigma factor [Nocardia sp. BSTN01]MBF5001656.1 sigma-70 family RNA polymerase sigma factor [Nocardia sp. BSTN01]
MRDRDELARRFEEHRELLRALAYRMLGSLNEAEDAVQEAWLRLDRATGTTGTQHGERGAAGKGAADEDPAEALGIGNLAAWLTTVVSRICLDQLRSRAARREELVDPADGSGALDSAGAGPPVVFTEPEAEAVLADSVGRALLVVLRTLSPDERVAFVLHDMFAVPFDEIAPIVGRTAATTKKLASRARHRVRGDTVTPTAELARHREVVTAFLSAARAGDLGALLAVLAPDVVRTADPAMLPPGIASVVRGAAAVAEETVLLRSRSRVAGLALVDGRLGLVVAPHGTLAAVLLLTVREDRVAAYDVVADPARLDTLTIAVPPPAR